MTDLLCLGEAMVEFVRLESGDYRRGFGGDTSNAAIAAARQGASVGYLSALGTDRFGDSLIDLWSGEGVDTSHIHRDPDAPTGIYFVDPDPEGRFFTYYREASAASRMQPGDLPSNALANTRCLHLSGITLAASEQLRATGLAAVDMVRGAGGAVSLDTNLRLKLWDLDTARRVLTDTMSRADIAVTSIDDSAHLTGLSDPVGIARHYHNLGPRIVLVTMGGDGCHLSHPGGQVLIPPARARAVDSTGAGDTFAGAFLAWWLETEDPERAARRAAIAAAGTVSGYGAVDPIPTRAAVLAAE
ncbi:MAG: sugar kinase [Pseudomonadota bacterium]